MYRTLAALGLPRSVYYAWKKRENLENRAGKPCRLYEVLPEERGSCRRVAIEFLAPRTPESQCQPLSEGSVRDMPITHY